MKKLLLLVLSFLISYSCYAKIDRQEFINKIKDLTSEPYVSYISRACLANLATNKAAKAIIETCDAKDKAAREAESYFKTLNLSEMIPLLHDLIENPETRNITVDKIGSCPVCVET